MDMRGRMSRRRYELLKACDGNREQVRRIEESLHRKSVARRRALRKRRAELAQARPDHLESVK